MYYSLVPLLLYIFAIIYCFLLDEFQHDVVKNLWILWIDHNGWVFPVAVKCYRERDSLPVLEMSTTELANSLHGLLSGNSWQFSVILGLSRPFSYNSMRKLWKSMNEWMKIQMIFSSLGVEWETMENSDAENSLRDSHSCR